MTALFIESLESRLLLSTAYTVTQWISSTQSNPWAQVQPPVLVNGSTAAPRTITIDPTQEFQTVTGFGGAVNELGWEALSTLPSAGQTAVLQNLFTSSGTAFSYIRSPIGANDFSDDYYSYDDTPGDYALANFSIARDEQELIPYINAAIQVNPAIQVWSSPWTPPAWMKTNDNYAGGSLTWNAQTLQTYANYLADYVQAYQAQGIPLFAIDVQNEPVASQVFPSALWTGAQEDQFIADYLGPTFAQRNIHVQIWLGTINDATMADYAGIVLADPTAAAYVSGVGYQWAGQSAIAATYHAYPNVPLMQTESEIGDGNNTWADGQATFSFLLQDFDAGVSSYMYWNMVLNQTGTSTWGWKQDSMITVNTQTGAVTYNPDYYAMMHFSQLIPTGSVLISATASDWGDKAAFLAPNGDIIVEMGNSAPQAYTDALDLPGSAQYASIVLPAQSYNTFILTPIKQPTVTSVAVNGNLSSLAGAQRSMVDSILYTFSQAVNITGASAFSLNVHPGQTGTVPSLAVAALNPNPDGSSPQWVVTFTGNGVVGTSIANGVYDIALNASDVTLDGNPTVTAQARPTDTFYRLYGDVTGSGRVNTADYFAFLGTFGLKAGNVGYLAAFDFGGTGAKISTADYFDFLLDFGQRFSGFTATI